MSKELESNLAVAECLVTEIHSKHQLTWETSFVGCVALHHHMWGLNSSEWVHLFNGCMTMNLGTFTWKNILKMGLIPHYGDPCKPPGLLSNDRRLGSSHFRRGQVLICGGLKQ